MLTLDSCPDDWHFKSFELQFKPPGPSSSPAWRCLDSLDGRKLGLGSRQCECDFGQLGKARRESFESDPGISKPKHWEGHSISGLCIQQALNQCLSDHTMHKIPECIHFRFKNNNCMHTGACLFNFDFLFPVMLYYGSRHHSNLRCSLPPAFPLGGRTYLCALKLLKNGRRTRRVHPLVSRRRAE